MNIYNYNSIIYVYIYYIYIHIHIFMFQPWQSWQNSGPGCFSGWCWWILPGVRNCRRPGRFCAVASAAAKEQQADGQRRMWGARGRCLGGEEPGPGTGGPGLGEERRAHPISRSKPWRLKKWWMVQNLGQVNILIYHDISSKGHINISY